MLPLSQKTYTGYTYNPDAEGSITKGTLKKISSASDILTLKLYYDLTVYAVTVENDEMALQLLFPDPQRWERQYHQLLRRTVATASSRGKLFPAM